MHLELRLVQTARRSHQSGATVSTSATIAATTTTRTVARVLLLAPVVDALVVVQAVERTEHLVAEIAHRVVERLQVLLLLVALQRELRAQQLAADVAPVAGGQRQGQRDPSRAVIRDYMWTARGVAVGALLLLRRLAHNTAEDARGARIASGSALERNYVQTVALAALVMKMAVVVVLMMML